MGHFISDSAVESAVRMLSKPLPYARKIISEQALPKDGTVHARLKDANTRYHGSDVSSCQTPDILGARRLHNMSEGPTCTKSNLHTYIVHVCPLETPTAPEQPTRPLKGLFTFIAIYEAYTLQSHAAS